MNCIAKILIVPLLFPMLAQPDITVNVDKFEKHIEVTICNELEKGHIKYHDIHVEKKIDNGWMYVRHYMGCPCNAKCRRKQTKLGPGECTTHRWDKKNGKCENVGSGTFRFVMRSDGDPSIIVKSCEFTIN